MRRLLISSNVIRRILLFTAITACLPAYASHGFSPFTAVYEVSRNDTPIGMRTHRLTKNSDGFTYQSTMQATGLASLFKPEKITELSHWQLKNNQVIPLHYEYHDHNSKKRHAQLEFDWQNHTVTNKIGNKPWKMSIPDGTQDKFSYMLALMQDLQHGKRETRYKIADGGHLKTYHFKVLGNETLTTPLGTFETLKLQRLRKNKKNRRTFLWVLPTQNHLPIKIQQHKDDNIFTMEINKLSTLTSPP